MRYTKEELLEVILNIEDPNELYKLKSRLEVSPFCGVENCYDLEKFVFSMLSLDERKKVITHIRKISKNMEPRIHVFTTYDYFKKIENYNTNKNIKCFLNKNSDYITILSPKQEFEEIAFRGLSDKDVSMISRLELDKAFMGDIPVVTTLTQLENDSVSHGIADIYFRTIVNYTRIFPEFIPVFIADATNANILLAHKMNDIRQSIDFRGCILDNSINKMASIFENHSIKIHFFTNEKEFMGIFMNIVTSVLPKD